MKKLMMAVLVTLAFGISANAPAVGIMPAPVVVVSEGDCSPGCQLCRVCQCCGR